MSTAVLIVNYKTYADLDRALVSLTPFLRKDDEVIVVDHESDRAQVVALAANHPSVTVLPFDDNPGFAAGVNRAAKRSRAPYLLLLNPDSRVEGPVVSVLEDWLRAHPTCAAVGPRIVNDDGSVQPSARRFPGFSTVFGGRSTWLTRHFPHNWFSRRNLIAREATAPVDVDWLSGACVMTRRDVFTRLGGLDESFFLYWEDADYGMRVHEAGLRSTYLPLVTVCHEGGISARYDLPRAIRSFHDSAFHLYRKHTGPLGRVAAPVAWAGLYLRGELRVWQAKRAQRAKLNGQPVPHMTRPRA